MKTVIEMAREAGAIPIHKRPKEVAVVGNEHIERFFHAAYAKGQADEREALAKHFDAQPFRELFGGTVAEEIRARGNT